MAVAQNRTDPIATLERPHSSVQPPFAFKRWSGYETVVKLTLLMKSPSFGSP